MTELPSLLLNTASESCSTASAFHQQIWLPLSKHRSAVQPPPSGGSGPQRSAALRRWPPPGASVLRLKRSQCPLRTQAGPDPTQPGTNSRRRLLTAVCSDRQKQAHFPITRGADVGPHAWGPSAQGPSERHGVRRHHDPRNAWRRPQRPHRPHQRPPPPAAAPSDAGAWAAGPRAARASGVWWGDGGEGPGDERFPAAGPWARPPPSDSGRSGHPGRRSGPRPRQPRPESVRRGQRLPSRPVRPVTAAPARRSASQSRLTGLQGTAKTVDYQSDTGSPALTVWGPAGNADLASAPAVPGDQGQGPSSHSFPDNGVLTEPQARVRALAPHLQPKRPNCAARTSGKWRL
ncbi:collagen alpha-1(I) chain-like [Eumetopias jubatus]|uniref:collagen alpha-1(I) chain-like n=1 Tax=Eumetopias jubatus TaxID=34886 RepID=UPI0010162187|nr:collagen alpha-1(I) chain-like [Eumetopias jubatus]